MKMARIARVVVPGFPHHVIQRGNRRQLVFFSDEDRRTYLNLLTENARKAGITLWAYCLMDNHVHFVAVPREKGSLAKGFGLTHKKYTRFINFREDWRGYLWQGRFQSFPLHLQYLYAAIRYVERNPVRAALVRKPEEYAWSSARAHIKNINDPLISDFFLTSGINDWAGFLNEEDNEKQNETFRLHSRTGRPLGDDVFLEKLEKTTGMVLRKQRPGPTSNSPARRE